MCGKKVKIKIDRAKFRQSDIQELRGDNHKLKKLGFKNKFNIDKTLKDSLNWWMKNYKN